MKRNLFAVIILFFTSGVLNCQTFQETDLDSEYFQFKVKSLDDFIGRFNYQRNPYGDFLQYHDSLRKERAVLLLSLFDTTLLMNSPDSITTKTVKNFIQRVVWNDEPVFFDYYSQQWYAEAICPAAFSGKNVQVSFFIRTKQEKNGNSRWEIFNVKADFMDFGNPNPEVFIGPAAHNLNFLDVSKTTIFNPQNFIGLLPEGFVPDRLSVVTWLISHNILKIEPFSKVSFDIYQVPGFYFRIVYFNRPGPNSGWLISDIKN